jgi:GWxTD domain-containing protein
MYLSRSPIRATLLLFPLFCAKPILAQEKPPHHPCFEPPNGSKDAIRRLPESARYWLAEDALYIIMAEERCAFLHLNTDEEREQFIGQFWYRRTVDPTSLDHDSKTEHYRRIVFANENYGGQLAGWKTDRGRMYALFGPPDSVDWAFSAVRSNTFFAA